MVAMAIMVSSFRVSVDDWLAQLLAADLYVRSAASGVVSNDGQTVYVANGSVLPAVTAAAGRFGGAHGQIVSVPAAPLCSG